MSVRVAAGLCAAVVIVFVILCLVFRRLAQNRRADRKDADKTGLVSQVLESEKTLADIEDCKRYVSLFRRLLEPLQTLCAVGKALEAGASLTSEQISYYFSYSVAEPLRSIVREEKKYREQQTDYPEQIRRKQYMKRDPDDLRRMLQENREKEKRGSGYQMMKRTLLQMEEEQILLPLTGWEGEGVPESQLVSETAKQAAEILQKNGLYLLYYNDAKVKNDSALQCTFTEGGVSALETPGVFIMNDAGRLELYGAYGGIYQAGGRSSGS
ncbi:MAG: hypothetical protein LUG27_05560 [Clostridiales bacterium]|nr:hypothetical protein [Clostridiales bacterium]